ncbi:uncharacterized protein [Primulina eburnea]|uniref:uncharacterized protein n=1 Tax=Primulina eburnea TaxID=1245227 RepID=UPI003C6C1DA6
MSITLSTPLSKTPTKFKFCSHKVPSFPRIHQKRHSFPFSYSSITTNLKPLNGLHKFYAISKPNLSGFPSDIAQRSCVFVAKAQNESGISEYKEEKAGDDETEARGRSSMPERFRYLTKEAPGKSVRWPWLIVLGFMLYAWRAALWELSNWKKSVRAIFRFLGYILKLALALIFHFIGDPITSLIHGFESALYTVRAFYSSVISYAPVQELVTIIMLTSAVLAIAEATVPDSVNSQPYLLSLAGLIGFAAVRNYISELFFWTLLVFMFGFAKLVKKRDYVSSALAPAAVLAAVGEPWVRVITMVSYLTLAVFHYSNYRVDVEEEEDSGAINRVPVPLLCAALAIGVRLAAKWAGYRHLTWMIV